MKYRVIVQLRASADIEQAYERIRGRSPISAVRWYNGITAAIQGLENQPARCGLAPEAEVIGIDVRQLLYGKRRGVYRILFTIQDEWVSVLHVRHSAQDAFRRRDLGMD